MPLDHQAQAANLTVAERRLAGQDLRKQVPRSLHSTWSAQPDRPDPISILIEAGRHRIASLLPIRYDRMRQSAFAFYRGAAAIMASDLANTPTSGLRVQACGDAHLANFSTYASPEGIPVFDVNDFDETLSAPFEWDVKRLATSFVLDARSRGLPEKECRHLARTATLAYRAHMGALIRLSPLEIWLSRINVLEAIGEIEDHKLREREMKRLQLAMEATGKGFPKLLERHRGTWRIREKSPEVLPMSGTADDTHEIAARASLESYKKSLQEDRRILLNRYRLADVAFKVVGVGSVGTFCAIGLYVTPDDETMLLQIKEAQTSVLAPFAGPSPYANHGERVVTGHRMMQAVSDVFLGWTDDGGDLNCYVRQLKDPRLALIGTQMADGALSTHAHLCGRALARAHARTGDAARIAGYMGSGSIFDAAIADFAADYADQTERDWRLLLDAINEGHIEAHSP